MNRIFFLFLAELVTNVVSEQNFPTRALSNSLHTSTECTNIKEFTYEDFTCQQIQINNGRRQKFCLKDEVRESCPKACGICCKDDESYEFKLDWNNELQDCLWLTKSNASSRIEKYCGTSQSQYGPTIRDACPVSCDFCQDFVELLPLDYKIKSKKSSSNSKSSKTKKSIKGGKGSKITSSNPSVLPSTMPSSIPSAVPSEYPSASPSRVPSPSPSVVPSSAPSYMPSAIPSTDPSSDPSVLPSTMPSKSPSSNPSVLPSHIANEDEWSFIVLADWHNAEYFAINPSEDSKAWHKKYNQIQYLKETYGGDLVVLPGDSNNGKWDTKKFAEKYKPEFTVKERVLDAGRNCYGTMRKVFRKAGYEIILMAVGDHELGGNAWGTNTSKLDAIQEYRQGIYEGFNIDPSTGEVMFTTPIGSAPSRPLMAPFKFTSYAYQHKNVLFITVDAFHEMNDNFMDRKNGVGGEGAITCTVQGDHLNWLKTVLLEAQNINTIKHIIVQAHLPIIQPVRKVSCSGQFMDNAENSEFWRIMALYEVDIYLAGEVHITTVTKDPKSNLVQIVSRGNSINNFLKIDVTDKTLKVTAYNEIGSKAKYNNNFTAYGNLMLDKSNLMSDEGEAYYNRKSDQGEALYNHKIACGSSPSHNCKKDVPKTISVDMKYPVRCCSDTYISTKKYTRKECPFATSCFDSSTFYNVPFNAARNRKCSYGGNYCSGSLTYEQAEALCKTAGAYICTIEDLANNCAKNTGCAYNNELVWSKELQPTRSLSYDVLSLDQSFLELSTESPTISPKNKRQPVKIYSSGVLQILDRASALVHLNFIEILPLESRQVVGMRHEDEKENLVAKRMSIRGIECTNSLPNQGSFGQPYDAQVDGIDLVHEGENKYGAFTHKSRLSIYGMGPHSAGSTISYAIRIKTTNVTNMILVHYGHKFGFSTFRKNIYTLTLDNGNPKLYTDDTSILKPLNAYTLNDGDWHDIAVSMPRKSCTLSEIDMYVDGQIVETNMPKNNEHIFFVTSGHIGIGGFGYSHENFGNSHFLDVEPYTGDIDYFYLWGRKIGVDDLPLLLKTRKLI